MQLPLRQTIGMAHFLFTQAGLKISGEGEWKVKKHGIDNNKHRQWLKIHIGTDYASRQIIAVRTTHAHDHDNQSLIPLLNNVSKEYNLDTAIGDGAYDSKVLYHNVRTRGAVLITPPPRNATWHGDIKHGELIDIPGWETRNTHVRKCMRLGIKEWKRQSGYHKRSLAKTTMFRLKQSFGGKLKSRKRVNQDAEVNLCISLLNLFTSYGLPEYTVV